MNGRYFRGYYGILITQRVKSYLEKSIIIAISINILPINEE